MASRIPDAPASTDPAGMVRWMRQAQQVIETTFAELRTRKQERGEVMWLRPFAVADLPDAANYYNTRGVGFVFVTDETGGAIPAYSDGTDWRRVTDGTVVS